MQLFTIKSYPMSRPAKSPAPLPEALHMSPQKFLKMTSLQIWGCPERFHQPGEACIPNADTLSFHNQQEEIR